ncbi:MAG: phospho-N-acetylmuramoyl-pentapeptide-transferase [Candidatus Spechtbacterales bacterium]
MLELNTLQLVRVLSLAGIAFMLTILWTPALTHFLYKYKLGKRIRKDANAPIFMELHQHKEGTPTMGGILIWGTVFVMLIFFWGIDKFFPDSLLAPFNFLNRGQTYLPLAAFFTAALIGLADDLLGIFKIGPKGGGIRMRQRLLLYTAIAILGAWWFYFKLEWTEIHVPFVGDFNIGLWYIPFFMLVLVATAFSTNEADGLDGLAGGLLMMAFASYGVLAFMGSSYDLAAFVAIIIGSLLAFLWFNVPPARFFMGDTGSMSLGVTLGIIALLTDQALLLLIVGFLLVVESLSVIVQLFWKKVFKKKLFLSTPIHHHFQAIGWPEHKIVMRFWIMAAVSAGLGIIIGLVG